MPVACFLGRGKVHGLPAAVGTTVDGNSLDIAPAFEGAISKVGINCRKVRQLLLSDFSAFSSIYLPQNKCDGIIWIKQQGGCSLKIKQK